MLERLGIAEELAARRALYARFQYRAPTFVEPMPAPKPRPKIYPPTRAFKQVVAAVCGAWSVTEYDLLGPRRPTRLTHPRFALYRICRERLGWSLPRIACAINLAHHQPVMHGIDRAKELNRHHRDWRNRYKAALIELRGGVV